MAAPQEKLASALEALKKIQDKSGVVVRADELSRTHRTRLIEHGFLLKVMRGWYIATSPSDRPGDTTPWFASYWDFISRYLTDRFGDEWCLSPEASCSLLAGHWAVPRQLLIRAPLGSNKPVSLLHDTSIYDMRVNLPDAKDMQMENGVRLYTAPAALLEAKASLFNRQPINLQAILADQRDASTLLSRLLEGGHSVVAGRLAGAFRVIGRERMADDIVKTMTSAGYVVRERDPFQSPVGVHLSKREVNPAATRIRLMWHSLREDVIQSFPKAPGLTGHAESYFKRVDDAFVTDAYHSLSIEGYRVDQWLIERVRGGHWNPDSNSQDRQQHDALAARGYWQAFQEVKKSVDAVLSHQNPGRVAHHDHGGWYRELFGASVSAGILKPTDLAGYRSDRVFIRNSMHAPLAPHALPDAMQVFFELLTEESDPAVRVVLGHFVFVYIHPYMDGNGRMGRFLMNLMLAAGGYPWTVIPVERRSTYMDALEQASVHGDIVPLSHFIGELVLARMEGAPLPSVPPSSNQ